MKKFILLFLILINTLFAYNYDNVLLKAQASIFPKIMLLDKKLKEKLVDDKIVYAIIYDKSDYQIASDIKKFIDEKYNGYLDKYQYEINLVEFSDFSTTTRASAVYVLNSDKDIDHTANIAKEKGIISFAYDLDNLKRGLMFSLTIEKSTILYLEKENLYAKYVDFVESLLQMVKFVDSNTHAKKDLYNNYIFETIYARID